jgi:ribosomal protein S18 acetylase RimI-like enzyme
MDHLGTESPIDSPRIADTMITTKPATEKDHQFIHQVHRLTYRAIIERQFGYWDAQRQSGLVDCDLATDRYEIVLWQGVPCGFFSFNTDGGRLHLINFAIHPQYQGRGIGSRILEQMKQRAQRKNQPLTLGAYKTNMKARKFYESHGLRKSGETTVHILYRWQPASSPE